jgi:hypothetical protein
MKETKTPIIQTINSNIKLWIYRVVIGIAIFLFLFYIVQNMLLIFLMPNFVYNPVVQLITGVIIALIAFIISIRVKENSFKPRQTKKQNVKKFYLFLFLFFILMMCGTIVYLKIKSANDKSYYQSHNVEFSIIKHDEIQDTKLYANVKIIQTTIDSLRNRYQINPHGTPLKELHLYANHESFVKQTGKPNDTAAFFSLQSGIPCIYLPSDLYLQQPELLLHETMHSFMYEVLGESYREIPLWFHDGYSQYSSLSWLNLLDKRVQTRQSLWRTKPKNLLESSFLLTRFNYPSDSITRDLFYNASFAFTDYIELKSSNNLFVEVLYAMSAGDSFDEIINEQFDIGIEVLYYEWVKTITGLETKSGGD